MNDTLSYVEHDPVHRRFHHDELTFSLVYAWDENFVLPLSHDEVVHGKRSLLSSSRATAGSGSPTLRALYGPMWAHPGKQCSSWAASCAEWVEWSESRSLDWPLLDDPDHAGVPGARARPQCPYRRQPALWEVDFRPEGFAWLVGDARDENVIAFARFAGDGPTLVVASTSPRWCGKAGGCRSRAAGAGSRCSTPTRASTPVPTSATVRIEAKHRRSMVSLSRQR